MFSVLNPSLSLFGLLFFWLILKPVQWGATRPKICWDKQRETKSIMVFFEVMYWTNSKSGCGLTCFNVTSRKIKCGVPQVSCVWLRFVWPGSPSSKLVVPVFPVKGKTINLDKGIDRKLRLHTILAYPEDKMRWTRTVRRKPGDERRMKLLPFSLTFTYYSLWV